MITKWLLRFSWLVISLIILLLIFGFFLGRHWGRDVESLVVTQGKYSFKAERDEVGVWKVRVKDDLSLSFAFGYIHAHDREFQTELFRRVATGRLATIFGEKVLKRDRLFRFFTHVAKDEFQRLKQEQSPLPEALEAYVNGRNHFMKGSDAPEPVEYRIFHLERAHVEPWQAWELLAISRLHAWQFSSDYRDEILRTNLRQIFGNELSYLFSPSEPLHSSALYDQALAKKHVKNLWPSSSIAKDHPLSPKMFEAVNAATAALPLVRPPSKRKEQFEDPLDNSFVFGHSLAASNSWIIADPRVGRELTLCNDTHLDFMFPSALYPLRYELQNPDNVVRGTGYSLPGVPFLLLGKIEQQKTKEKLHQSLVIGITIADFADSQDLVKLSTASLKKSKAISESFEIRDPLTQKVETKTFQAEWTPYGPRVDEFLDWGEISEPGPMALDWVGFRKVHAPLEFFRQRNLHAGQDLMLDLTRYWDFPSVNLSYIQDNYSGERKAGHVVTGMFFEDPSGQARALRNGFSEEAQVDRRKMSYPWQRPFIESNYQAKDPLYVVSANHRIWSGDFGLRGAFQWTSSNRADRIEHQYEKNVLDPSWSQTDFYSTDLSGFTKKIRSEINADRLCATRDVESNSACLDLLAHLDRWDGLTDKAQWETSVISLWRNMLKSHLWKPLKETDDQRLQKWWLGSNMSDRSFAAILHEPIVRSRWEALTGQNFIAVATQSFGEALSLLETRLGPEVSNWKWGTLHGIEWGHPFSQIPEPLGPALRDSLLGSAPEVSGTEDSPGATVPRWDPKNPTAFPAVHGAVMRFCADINAQGETSMKWANITGTSGNPFSEWAWIFARKTWFENKLLNVSK